MARRRWTQRDTVLVHGTTVATNALLERKGARTALVTTAGFEDLLELARQTRPSLYDFMQQKPPPLAPPEMCFGLDERVLADGSVERAPSPTQCGAWWRLSGTPAQRQWPYRSSSPSSTRTTKS